MATAAAPANEMTSTRAAFTRELAGKYLTFVLGSEEYGLPVLRVREIIRMMDITMVPQVPDYVKGVINLRGKVIPIIDLRLKFSFEPIGYGVRTSIIVVEVNAASGRQMTGIVVDDVSEVLSIAADEIEETPEFGSAVTTDYMKGVATVKGKVRILLDIDRVFGVEPVMFTGR